MTYNPWQLTDSLLSGGSSKQYSPIDPIYSQVPGPSTGIPYPQTLGDNTVNNSGPAGSPPPSGSPTPTVTNTGDGGNSGPSAEEIYRQQQIQNISNKWNSYFGQLDDLLGGLPKQADILTGKADISKEQSLSDLTASTQESQSELQKQEQKNEANQVKTLKDIAENIRNLMQAGNVYLGSMGAGDSSATNQYAYALTKLGSQQRGDVVSQTRGIWSEIQDRMSKVANIFTQEKNRINSEYNMQVADISQWLVEQQNQIKQLKAQGQLQKGEDIQALTDNLYNIAVQNISNIKNYYTDQTAALQEWALNNSKSLQEAQQKLQGAGSFIASTPQYGQISGTPQVDSAGNLTGPITGGGGYRPYSDEEKSLLYG